MESVIFGVFALLIALAVGLVFGSLIVNVIIDALFGS